MARGSAETEDVGALRPLLGEVMNCVRVVPVQTEVGRGRLHGGELGGDRLRHDGTARVRIGRDDPHALHRRVLDEFTHGHHVRSVVVHGDVDHADAELLGEREVTVVARDRADERDLLFLRPRTRRVRRAVEQGEHQRVVHDLEAAVAFGDELVERNVQEIGEDLTQFGESGEAAVVARVRAVGGTEVVAGQAQQADRKVQLRGGRLAAGEIELETGTLERRVGAPELVAQGLQLVGGEIVESHGSNLPTDRIPDRTSIGTSR